VNDQPMNSGLTFQEVLDAETKYQQSEAAVFAACNAAYAKAVNTMLEKLVELCPQPVKETLTVYECAVGEEQ
jgi:hypothetical protein